MAGRRGDLVGSAGSDATRPKPASSRTRPMAASPAMAPARPALASAMGRQCSAAIERQPHPTRPRCPPAGPRRTAPHQPAVRGQRRAHAAGHRHRLRISWKLSSSQRSYPAPGKSPPPATSNVTKAPSPPRRAGRLHRRGIGVEPQEPRPGYRRAARAARAPRRSHSAPSPPPEAKATAGSGSIPRASVAGRSERPRYRHSLRDAAGMAPGGGPCLRGTEARGSPDRASAAAAWKRAAHEPARAFVREGGRVLLRKPPVVAGAFVLDVPAQAW